ncbi:hypothetical protein TREMEDRAFT_59944 [Tremella mesenterica DSM 1558]|uniref:uncharacterized protein n=1 Tax=Tremella mesenterica (strain ATCC 24925 / CBS 8224 / DSM 1558 / NBRC 9311 / NRRL Y-6157 / RJB 2259-6 / UBC 559-6) TaxID=578456 RepID=UPI0003F493CC|nr:uncharacterized protein TREMEDRAFT_59944 [Tremella mesenterica DSM 1558]EIW71001.1 hypothetical protein TREMEDRAFT_59944 [Tremella mesenterica DSM 1558]
MYNHVNPTWTQLNSYRKETKHDKAERIYRREQRRLRKETERISRANGYAVSPPRSTRPDSTSPPRKRPPPAQPNDPTIDDEHDHRGGHLQEEIDRREMEERMAWLAGEEMSRANGNPFADYGYPTDVHVPRRYRDAAGIPSSSSRAEPMWRGWDSGAAPPLKDLTEEEYAEWVREGMYRMKNKAEVEERERRQREKQEREAERERARERALKEERRRIKQLEKQKGLRVEEERKMERERYLTRWKMLVDTGGEVEEAELRYSDIPWPVYGAIKTMVRRLRRL